MQVQAWARQHQQRMAVALSELRAVQELLEGLLAWLQWAHSSLELQDTEPLPQEIEQVKALIAQHQVREGGTSPCVSDPCCGGGWEGGNTSVGQTGVLRWESHPWPCLSSCRPSWRR